MNCNKITVGDMVLVIRNTGDSVHDKQIGRIATVTDVQQGCMDQYYVVHPIVYFLDNDYRFMFFKEELLKITPPPIPESITKVEEIEDFV